MARPRRRSPSPLPPWTIPSRPIKAPSDILRARKKAPEWRPVEDGDRTVHAEPRVDKPCVRKTKATGEKKTLRACQVELVLLGEKHAGRYGVEPGPYLRFCEVYGKAGPLQRVRDQAEASDLATRWCACRKTSTVRACKAKISRRR